MSERPNSTVECQTCSKQIDVDFSTALRQGWPRCCGYTMHLVRRPHDISRATRKALEAQTN